MAGTFGWFIAPFVPASVAILLGDIARAFGIRLAEVLSHDAYLLVAPRGVFNGLIGLALVARTLNRSASSERMTLFRCAVYLATAAAAVLLEHYYEEAMLGIAWGGASLRIEAIFGVALATFGLTAAIMTLCALTPISRSSLMAAAGVALLVGALRSIPLLGAVLDFVAVGATFAVLANRGAPRLTDEDRITAPPRSFSSDS